MTLVSGATVSASGGPRPSYPGSTSKPEQSYCLGRHAPYKNLTRLIQAFAQLPTGAADLEL
ncbi:MAG: hypothetical protein ACKO21_05575 [Nodosilinea sp.]|jgi:hypothetical protein